MYTDSQGVRGPPTALVIMGFKNNNNTGKTANKVKQEEKTKEKHYIIRGLASQGKIQSQHLGNMLHD